MYNDNYNLSTDNIRLSILPFKSNSQMYSNAYDNDITTQFKQTNVTRNSRKLYGPYSLEMIPSVQVTVVNRIYELIIVQRNDSFLCIVSTVVPLLHHRIHSSFLN
jgi:hypothetical protein